jgi:RNA polymerase sigma-70 factor (ECF subfamily)
LKEPATVKLVQKAKKGDRHAFEELCGIKSKKMLFIAYNILGDYHEAEDAVQEAIIAMFMNIKTLRSDEAFDAWMSRIVRTKCSRQLKIRTNLRETVDIDDHDLIIEDNDKEFLPEAYAENAELRKKLYDIILTLSPKRREVIIMYYYENLSYKEIAKITDTSIKTVASNITRAREMIKDALSRREQGAKRLTASGSALVISRALENQATQMIPDSMVSAFRAKWTSALKPIKYPIAQTSVIFKNIAIAAVCSAIAITGAVTLPSYIGGVRSDLSAGVSAEVYPTGDISFAGGDCECGHINPSSSTLKVGGLGVISSEPQWRVIDEATNTKIASGSGYEVSGIFENLETAGRTGKYTLTYEAKDEEGVAITARRVFEIIPRNQLAEGRTVKKAISELEAME